MRLLGNLTHTDTKSQVISLSVVIISTFLLSDFCESLLLYESWWRLSNCRTLWVWFPAFSLCEMVNVSIIRCRKHESEMCVYQCSRLFTFSKLQLPTSKLSVFIWRHENLQSKVTISQSFHNGCISVWTVAPACKQTPSIWNSFIIEWVWQQFCAQWLCCAWFHTVRKITISSPPAELSELR